MVDGILELIPAAKVGHIGLYRDPETLEPVEYYCKLPEDIGERDILIVDPMLATGGSAAAAVRFLRERGAQTVRLLCLISAPEGIARPCSSPTPTCWSTRAPSTTTSTTTATSCRASATPGDRLFGTK